MRGNPMEIRVVQVAPVNGTEEIPTSNIFRGL